MLFEHCGLEIGPTILIGLAIIFSFLVIWSLRVILNPVYVEEFKNNYQDALNEMEKAGQVEVPAKDKEHYIEEICGYISRRDKIIVICYGILSVIYGSLIEVFSFINSRVSFPYLLIFIILFSFLALISLSLFFFFIILRRVNENSFANIRTYCYRGFCIQLFYFSSHGGSLYINGNLQRSFHSRKWSTKEKFDYVKKDMHITIEVAETPTVTINGEQFTEE